jgi:hypothetical protein
MLGRVKPAYNETARNQKFLYVAGTFCLIKVFEKGSSGLQITQSEIFFS